MEADWFTLNKKGCNFNNLNDIKFLLFSMQVKIISAIKMNVDGSFIVCVLRCTSLMDESLKAALVVGRIRPRPRNVHREVESEGKTQMIVGFSAKAEKVQKEP